MGTAAAVVLFDGVPATAVVSALFDGALVTAAGEAVFGEGLQDLWGMLLRLGLFWQCRVALL